MSPSGPRVVSKPVKEADPVPAQKVWGAQTYTRLVLSLLLAWWGYAIYQDPGESVLHNIILPIHESGHIIFMFFGEVMQAFGGSFFQVIFPLIFAAYFYRQGDKHAATIPLWFAGVAAVDIVPYIKDAPYGEIELIGGEHDWSFILGEFAWTRHAEAIGNWTLHFGGSLMLAALVLGIYWLPKSEPAPTS